MNVKQDCQQLIGTKRPCHGQMWFVIRCIKIIGNVI